MDARQIKAYQEYQEYLAKVNEMTQDIPEEFKQMLVNQAWDRGHSAGYPEVFSILADLVWAWRDASMKYSARTGTRFNLNQPVKAMTVAVGSISLEVGKLVAAIRDPQRRSSC